MGTTQHLAAELFKLRTGTYIVHIPYKGSAPSLTALIAGEVDLSFANVPAIHGHVTSGRLRALATAASRRDPQLPDVPTMKEAGIEGVEVSVWYGVFAPAALPKDLLAKLNADIAAILKAPDLKERLDKLGAEPGAMPQDAFARYVRDEITKWAKVVKDSGASVD